VIRNLQWDRLYFIQSGRQVIVLLAGGDKHTQDADIARAYHIANQWKDA